MNPSSIMGLAIAVAMICSFTFMLAFAHFGNEPAGTPGKPETVQPACPQPAEPAAGQGREPRLARRPRRRRKPIP